MRATSAALGTGEKGDTPSLAAGVEGPTGRAKPFGGIDSDFQRQVFFDATTHAARIKMSENGFFAHFAFPTAKVEFCSIFCRQNVDAPTDGSDTNLLTTPTAY